MARPARAEGGRWYGLVYRAIYLLGLRVWEREARRGLVQLVEGVRSKRRAGDQAAWRA